MIDESKVEEVATAIRQINQAWLTNRVDDLASMVHPGIVMVFPGFARRIRGREELLAGFHDFCTNATIQEFREHDQQIDVVGDTAVVAFRYEMIYERSGGRFRANGRDLWVLQHEDSAWIAVWRTMLEMDENAI
jgi:hypothetical protein